MKNTWQYISKKYIEYCFLPNSLYNKTNSQLFSFVSSLLKKNKKLKILDLGCGPGNTILYFWKKLRDGYFVGVDKEKNFIEFAKKLSKREGIKAKFYLMSAENFLSKTKERFDLIISNSALWHMDLPKIFKSLSKIMKPNAIFAFNLAPHAVGEKIKFNVELCFDNILKEKSKELEARYIPHAFSKGIDKKVVVALLPKNLKIIKYKKIKIIQTKKEFLYFFDEIIIPRTWKKRFPSWKKEKATKLLKETIREVFDKINQKNKIIWRWHFYAIKNV